MNEKRYEDEYSTGCKFCGKLFMCDDDLAEHESCEHGSDLSDFKLQDGQYRLKD